MSSLDLSIQPVVLVGGRSRRFGRDKLREPLGPPTADDSGSSWLVDRPIGALRAVFGRHVALVGDCDAAVRSRADLHWPDLHPGAGPAGGVLTALERAGGDVFVLAGDMAAVTEATVRRVLAAAGGAPEAWVVLGRTDRPEPCLGVYRRDMAEVLRGRLADGAEPRLSLHDAPPAGRVAWAAVDAAEAANVNRPEDLPRR